MNTAPLKIVLTFSVLLTLLMFSSCKEECKDVLCDPCPSSKMLISYQDTTGACAQDFADRAVVRAFEDDWATLAFTYDFADSCTAGFLLEGGYDYVIWDSVMGISDTLTIDSLTYQVPLDITECCKCYPVNEVHFHLNGAHSHVTFPEGQYENVPFVRVLP